MYFLDGLCDCPRLLMPALGLVKKFIDLLKILVPIALIIWGIIDLTKAMMVSDDSAMKKAQGALVKKILAAVCVFLVPTIMNAVLSIVANGTKGEVDTGNWASCWSNVGDYESECGSGTTNNNNGTVEGGSACYLCGNFSGSKYVWTDSPDSKVCSKLADITTEGDCLKKNSLDYIEIDGTKYKEVSLSSLSCPHGTVVMDKWVVQAEKELYCYYNESYQSVAVGGATVAQIISEMRSSMDCSKYNNSYLLISSTEDMPDSTYVRGACVVYRVCKDYSDYKKVGTKYYCKAD